MRQPIHIVTRFDGVGGTENHAAALFHRLSSSGPVKLWADRPGGAASRYGATPINSFAGLRPERGTLILLGTHLDPGMWLDHVRPDRLIVICNLFSLERIFALLAFLDRPSLPAAELVFVSAALKAAACLPGRICPPLIDLDRFHPSRRTASPVFRLGRHSRDDPTKHHPEDASLYKMLGRQGIEVTIMGGESLRTSLAGAPGVRVLAVGERDAAEFTAGLDCFFYRPFPGRPEASGRCVIEALAAGAPVVASPGGGYVEWIEHGVNGFFVHSQEEAFERIVHLAGDRTSLSHYAAKARERAEQLCAAPVVAGYLAWLSA